MERRHQTALRAMTPPASCARHRFTAPPPQPASGREPPIVVEATTRRVLRREPRTLFVDCHRPRPIASPGPPADRDQWHCALVRGGQVVGPHPRPAQ